MLQSHNASQRETLWLVDIICEFMRNSVLQHFRNNTALRMLQEHRQPFLYNSKGFIFDIYTCHSRIKLLETLPVRKFRLKQNKAKQKNKQTKHLISYIFLSEEESSSIWEKFPGKEVHFVYKILTWTVGWEIWFEHLSAPCFWLTNC